MSAEKIMTKISSKKEMILQNLRLQEKEKEVLLMLTIEGLKTGYDLHSGRKKIISSSTWHYVRDSLIKKGLIEIKKEEPFRIRGRKRKFYGPTLRGIILVIAHLDEKDEKILNEIISKWSSLIPLVFGKWDLFSKEGIKKDAMDMLFHTSYLFLVSSDPLFYKTLYQGLPLKLEDPSLIFSLCFYEMILSLIVTSPHEPPLKWLSRDIRQEIEEKTKELRNKWLKCIVKDHEILTFVKMLIKDEMEDLKNALETRKEFLTELNKFEKGEK